MSDNVLYLCIKQYVMHTRLNCLNETSLPGTKKINLNEQNMEKTSQNDPNFRFLSGAISKMIDLAVSYLL